nr:DUF4097 family beta strand repeat-containing protein [Salirhabdus salicampi]
MDVHIENGTVNVKQWDEPSIRIEINADVYQVENEEEATDALNRHLHVDIQKQTLQIRSNIRKMKWNITLYLPEKSYIHGAVRIFNGPIYMKNAMFQTLNAKTSNGNITIDRGVGVKWELNTVNGNIYTNNVRCEQLQTEAIKGKVHLHGDFQKVDTQVVTGSIVCHWRGSSGYSGFFKSTTGNVDLYVPNNVQIEGQLKTNIGTMICNLPHQVIQSEKELLHSKMRFRTSGNGHDMFYIEAESKTGQVRVEPYIPAN